MKLSLRWLGEWIDVGASPEALAERMTSIGLAVDAIENPGAALAGVVVGKVLAVDRHPNADRLSLCRVTDGAAEHRVVCGAPNVRAGGLYPLARVGVSLPNGVTIREATIRGERSSGMLCSAAELGLSADHAGLLVLPDDAAAGAPLADALGMSDVVFEIDVPYNRPDWLAVRGIAREVGAALGKPLRPLPADTAARDATTKAPVRVTIEDRAGCPLYGARHVHELRVGPSPSWLKRALESVGQRSINNVVDVTNFVLHTLGQPTHAFDRAKLGGGEIRVRRARVGETLVTLDGVKRPLTADILVIADATNPVALAGIMGGEASQVTDATREILLEGALFDAATVRDGARKLGMSTDASIRFGRGVDGAGVLGALDFAARLIAEVGGGEVAGSAQDGAAPSTARTLVLRPARIERLLGDAVPEDEVVEIFERLGFEPTRGTGSVRVTVPSWRGDVEREEDLIEEVARYHGYNRFADRTLNAAGSAATRSTGERWLARSVAALVSLGFQEIQTSALLSEETATSGKAWGSIAPDLVRLLNAKSRDAAVLRSCLWPGQLVVAERNLNRGSRDLRLFEHGTVYGADLTTSPPSFHERTELAGLVRGDLVAAGWTRQGVPVDLFGLKGIVASWFEALGLEAPAFAPLVAAAPPLDATHACRFEGASGITGRLGRIDAKNARAADVPDDLWLFTIDFERCLKLDALTRCYHEPSRYPPVKRDLAFVVDRRVSHAELDARLRGLGQGLVRSITLFDAYEGPPVPDGQRSLAFSLTFQSNERSLVHEEVDELVAKIVADLTSTFGAKLRGA